MLKAPLKNIPERFNLYEKFIRNQIKLIITEKISVSDDNGAYKFVLFEPCNLF